MSTFEKEHPRDKQGKFVDKHQSVKPGVKLETWLNPQAGTFGECYRDLSYTEIPPIVGTQLKGSDGHFYEVSDVEIDWDGETTPVVTSQHTGVEVENDTDLFFDIEKLPTGALSNAYMSMKENAEKKYQSWRDFDKEKDNLEVLDCKYPREEDVWDGVINPCEAEVRIVDKNGNIYSTSDGGVPGKYGRMIHKYRMRHFWELKEDEATDRYENLVKQPNT